MFEISNGFLLGVAKMSDDDFRTGPSTKRPKKAAADGRQTMMVEDKWKGSDLVGKIKDHVSLFLL